MARTALDSLLKQTQGTSPFSGIATIYAALGEKDKAFDALGKAYELRDAWMPFLKADPFMDPLRSDPRFNALLVRLGLDK